MSMSEPITTTVELTAKCERTAERIVELSRKHEVNMVTTSNAIGAECAKFFKSWDGDKRSDAVALLKGRLYTAGLRNLDISKHVKTFALCSLIGDALTIPASVVQSLLPVVKLDSGCNPAFVDAVTSKEVIALVGKIISEGMHHSVVRDQVNAMLGKEKPKAKSAVVKALAVLAKLTDSQLSKLMGDPDFMARIDGITAKLASAA
jgi:hypothetical protein